MYPLMLGYSNSCVQYRPTLEVMSPESIRHRNAAYARRLCASKAAQNKYNQNTIQSSCVLL